MAGILPRHGIDLEFSETGGAMNSFFRKLSWLAQRRRKDDPLALTLAVVTLLSSTSSRLLSRA
jgi:hypothetical protein